MRIPTPILLLLLTLLLPSCNRAKKDPKDKIDDIPRGTGGTPATQLSPATHPTFP